MSDAIFPLEVWASGTNENSLPANTNALRVEAIDRNVISKTTTAQPGSPSDGDVYIIPSSATGAQWTTFTAGDIAIYRGGTWYAFAPVTGVMVNIAGTLERWNGSAWAPISTSGAPSVQSVTSSATVTPTFSDDLVRITAQAAGLTLANPTGSANEGWGIAIRIKDNGTPRSIAYGTQYRAIGVTLPTTTVASKTLYLGCIWNDSDTKLDVVSVAQEA